MSDDNEVQVKFSAEIAGLLDGLNEGQESLKRASEGMQGDLGALAKSFEALGPAALVAGAAMMAFESLEGIQEDIEQVNALARSFEGLQYQMGSSLDELNVYDATMKITGGSMNELEGWTTGVTRAMKANSEVFVANGVAASQAALMQMQPLDVMKASIEVIDKCTDQNRKLILAQEMLGRGAIAEIPQMKRFFESLEDGKKTFEEYGAGIDKDAIARMKMMEAEAGKLAVETETLKKHIAEQASGMDIAFGKVNLGFMQMGDSILTMWNKLENPIDAIMQLPGYLGSVMDQERDALNKDPEVQREKQRGVEHALPAGPQAKTKEELEAEKEAAKKAAEEAKRQAREAAAEAFRIAKTEAEEEVKVAKDKFAAIKEAGKANVTTGQQSPNEAVSDQIRGLEMVHTAETAANAQLIVAAKGKKAEIAKINAEQADEDRRLILETQALEDQQIKNALEARKKAEEADAKSREENARKTEELVKQTAAADIKAADDAFRAQDEIIKAQEMSQSRQAAAEIVAVNQEVAAKLAAIEKERQALEKLGQNTQSLLSKEVSLTQEAETKKLAIKLAADKKAEASYLAMMNKATANWDVGIQKMLHGEMTLIQGIRGATQQWEDQFENAVINMGLNWAKGMALQVLTGKEAHLTENLTTARSAAGHAYDATVGIPYVGPVLAPAAAATAYAAVVAFAEQGFDVGNYSPMTQLHPKEMVLPAYLADGFRQMLGSGSSGGAGGGGMNINIHNHGGIDAGAWFMKNQGALLKSIGDAAHNRRQA